MAETETPQSGTPSGTQFGVPMVKVAASGSEILAGITADQANTLIAIAGGFIGTIMPWASGGACPVGWMSCEAQALSRTTYSLLFNVIGITFGAGDGTTTFNIPDIRGRVIAGYPTGGLLSTAYSASGGMDSIAIGGTGGEQAHDLQPSEIPPHVHAETTRINCTAFGSSATARGAGGTLDSTTNTQGNTGGGGSHNNLQPTILLQWMIFYGSTT